MKWYENFRKHLENKKTRWIFVILVVVYIISPIDIIPDLIPMIGVVDDGFLLAITVIELTRFYRSKRTQQTKK